MKRELKKPKTVSLLPSMIRLVKQAACAKGQTFSEWLRAAIETALNQK
jgi:hypothetical protein